MTIFLSLNVVFKRKLMKVIYFKLFIKLLVSLPLLFSGVLMFLGSITYMVKEQDFLGFIGIFVGVVLVVVSFKLFKRIYPKE